MFGNLYRSLCSWGKHSKYRNVIIFSVITTIAGTVVLGIYDYKEAEKKVTSIQRGTHGTGDIKERLEVAVGGKVLEDEIEVEVSERQYTEEELEKVFKQSIESLEEIMLAENKSLDCISSDLNFINLHPDFPLNVEWKLDRYDVINIYGEIDEEKVRENPDGIIVTIEAYLQYQNDETKQAVHVMSCRVCPKEYSKNEELLLEVSEKIKTQEQATVTEGYLLLPEEIEGKKVEYKKNMNSRSITLLFFGLIFSLLIYFLEQEKKKENEQKKQEQMMRDYPEIISKLNLLIGAGMTVKNAWRKIVEDYQRQKAGQEVRFVYEEMGNTYREMQSGIPEAECYEHFGKNCRLKAYRKLGALLSQNLRKGTRGLTEMLSMESIQAYEERKMRAKRLGEEAGTKLLMPMFLMLTVVLIIVIVPAFLSIQM